MTKRLWTGPIARLLVGAGLFVLAGVAANDAAAGSISLGAADNFTVLATTGGNITINSATSITGNVGYGQNVTSLTNQKVGSFIGTAYVDSTANFNYTAATFAPTGGIVVGGAANTLVRQASLDALAQAAYFSGLAATQTLGNLTANTVVNRTGTQNVISLSSINFNSNTLTISGNAGDSFIFNVSGNFAFSQSNIVLNGLTADDVVFNFLNASSIDVNKSSSVFFGTILAPYGSVIYHNPGSFTGRIIGSDITLHSDFNIASRTDTATPVPLPSAAPAGAILLVMLAFCSRKRFAAKAP